MSLTKKTRWVLATGLAASLALTACSSTDDGNGGTDGNGGDATSPVTITMLTENAPQTMKTSPTR